jgi:hypothetical protein
MSDWTEILDRPVAAAEHGVATVEEHFATVHDGPLTFDRIDYPAAQVIVDTVERADATTWQHSISTMLYFDWNRESTTRETINTRLGAVTEATLASFAATECITDYHPARFDFFSGEPQGSLVLAVSIQFQTRTLVDPGAFGDE